MKFYVFDIEPKDESRSLTSGQYLNYYLITDYIALRFEYHDKKLSCAALISRSSIGSQYIEVTEDECVLSKVAKKVIEFFPENFDKFPDKKNVQDINTILETWYKLGFIKIYGFNENFDSRVNAWYNSLITAYNEKYNKNVQSVDTKKEVESDVVIAAKEYLKYKPKGFGNSKEDLIEMFKAGAAWCGNM